MDHMILLTIPDIGVKGGMNTTYNGVKDGLPYIGKSFNLLKRYSQEERTLMNIKPILNGINESRLLRAVEQKILEYQKKLGKVANKYNAFSPSRKDYHQYMQRAEQWLQQNAPNWKKLFE